MKEKIASTINDSYSYLKHYSGRGEEGFIQPWRFIGKCAGKHNIWAGCCVCGGSLQNCYLQVCRLVVYKNVLENIIFGQVAVYVGENVLENIIQVAVYVGERYRKPLEGLPPLKRGAGSFTKHSHFSLEIKKKYNGWSFIKMDHTAVYHNFHIFHLNVCTSSFNFCDLKKMQTFTFKRNIPI